jgi:hypothetical protein
MVLKMAYKKQTPWFLVLKPAIPTERPPLVGEVSAKMAYDTRNYLVLELGPSSGILKN